MGKQSEFEPEKKIIQRLNIDDEINHHLALMAVDPEIQAELVQINNEFLITETDGLGIIENRK